jgi:flagellar biosynthesis/type III secretory pathway M-ring protein FliF/YscJ
MGLKSGSRGAGLDEAEGSTEQADEHERETRQTEGSEGSSTPSADSRSVDAAAEAGAENEGASQRPSMDSIPYKLRRSKVNEGREQVPYFLRDEVIEAEDDLQDTVEDLLGESVYKSDYREAAMVVAQRRPELVAEILREWGYDLDGS